MAVTTHELPATVLATGVSGPPQGQWTYDAYAAIPDEGKRYEVIDGVLFMAPSPNEPHQSCIGNIYTFLRQHVQDKSLGRVYIAPFDVELSSGTVVQPDVVVVLNEHRDRVASSRIVGAPDLAVEVTSPGTETHDRNRKFNAYAAAGVPEYWIAGPESKTVELLILEGNTYRTEGVYQGSAILPTAVLEDFNVRVEQFFQ